MKLSIRIITKQFPFFCLLLAASMLVTGCKKDFLDEPRPTDKVSTVDVFSSTDGVRAFFNGLYRNLRSQWTSLDGSAGGNDDTYSFVSLNITRGAKGKDVVMAFPTWYIYDYQNENREPTYRRVNFTWEFLYENINQVNILIKGVAESPSISADDKTLLSAEARALRAWLYFELIREFQHTITKNPNAPGVPVYTEPTSIQNKGKARGTIKETYDQINSDIEFATANIGSSRNLKSQVNSNVAWGMAARIYLEQQRWADAKAAAQKARIGLQLDEEGYATYYNDLTSSEVIWGLPQTTGNGGQSLYYGTLSSFFEQTGDGYDGFYVSEELVDRFTTTDIRNTFFEYNAPGTPDNYATNKFGIAHASYEVTLLNGETVKQKTINFDESIIMMRVAEMVLIEAEAKARLGEADAAELLFSLQSNRDEAAVRSGNTGAALINEILVERRKELYGELGIDWLDAKRLQLALDRSGSNHEAPNDYIMVTNDPRLILKIPQKEIDSNDFINQSDQNP
ncbi:MAG: RagB/SusD family nutrient uptake outer membrane protein [Bacteroidota bacterium]